jgi:starch phosphorylase
MTVPIKVLDVKPKIPEALQSIKGLSENLWFLWNYEARDLFRRIDPELWDETQRNPVELLCRLSQNKLEGLTEDEGFLAHMKRVRQDFDRYMSEETDPSVYGEKGQPFLVAYFTTECGLGDCLPIYSGGLGILSGDHLKSASDLTLPIIGISLAYQKGYFRQYLTQDGWQMETYPNNQFTTMPMALVRHNNGDPIKVVVMLKDEKVMIQAWQVHVGRTRLFLLDTNVPENANWAKNITAELYGGDREMRICQEMVLGIGGVRLLKALGLDPAVYHMNEGHSAFAAFERIRALREEEGLSFNEALEFVRFTNVFTTHTPVSEGIDTFKTDLMRVYLSDFAKAMGISFEVLQGFGRQNPRNKEEEFSMAVLALRVSNWSNGVSRLHGQVSQRMWRNIWPHTSEFDLPITHVTNGIHTPSWISEEMAANYNRYLGPRWIEDPDNVRVWERVDKIPNTELWRTKERARERLVTFTRSRLRKQLMKRGHVDRDVAIADEILNPRTLTIGFARRFAQYKRADLVLRDIERLEKILTNEKYPVQIIFAGKAHPQDNVGKELIKRLIQTTNRETFRRHMVFLEDYDMEIARYMVQGVDVWLNTPRRPFEACGTSGMKAVANGVLHLSVLDGWWEEGFDRQIGWAIGTGEVYKDNVFQDDIESRSLYSILEKEIVPLFYERGTDGLPRRWLAMMKASLHQLCPMFNTHRMVEEYWDRFYIPAAEQGTQLKEGAWQGVKNLSAWREKIMFNWSNVAIKNIKMEQVESVELGEVYHVEADLFLGDLSVEDVVVEAYCGRLDPSGQYTDRFVQIMNPSKTDEDRLYQYQCDVEFEETGHFGLNIRITPNHPNPESRHVMGLAIWGQK